MNTSPKTLFLRQLAALSFIFCSPFRPPAAGEEGAVLPAHFEDATPGTMMEVYLKKQAFAALEQRELDFEKIKSPAQLIEWQQGRRESLLSALGGFPERTPLNARVTGQMAFADYRLEKIIFESQPGFHVTATLYLPLTPGPHPAAVHPTGHSDAAKGAELYQRASILLAKNGIACLCYDPVGQGERRQYVGEDGKPIFGTTGEHSLMDVSCTPLGTNVARYMIWDGMRAVDYLQSRADIDPKRIGATGISGGGTMSSYLGALDERIAVSAPGCYLTGFRRLLETRGPQDAEQNLFGQIARGLDHGDYVMLRAPRPTLVMAATQDFFDITGAWHLFRQSKRFYTRLGFSERVEILETDTIHGFPPDMRAGAARWLNRWLLGNDQPLVEQDFPVLSEEKLHSTPEGRVLRLAGAKSLVTLNQEWDARLAFQRRNLWQDRVAALAEVRRITGIRAASEMPEPVAVQTGKTERAGCTVEKILLKLEAGIWLPALRFEPKNSAHTAGPVLYLNAAGKEADAASGGPIEGLALAGRTVLAVDLRGVGETLHPQGKGELGALLGANSTEATLAYLLGKSFVAMRAEDVLVCSRYLLKTCSAAPHPVRVTVVAKGETGVPALHAVALEPEVFSGLSLERALRSWVSVVHSPVSENQKNSIVFGALRAYDLSDLVDSLPEGKIKITGALDANGHSPR